jgi:minor histocompatibility antigen H13
MLTVAKNFDAPIKILFPRDLFASELKFSMLGLGDIVIPGIFIALCLRFDRHLAARNSSGANNKKSTKKISVNTGTSAFPKPYFTACFIAYIVGLVTTVFVMHTWQAAQPALLYLSPACILSVLITAAVRGELKELFAYQSENKVTAKDEKKTE